MILSPHTLFVGFRVVELLLNEYMETRGVSIVLLVLCRIVDMVTLASAKSPSLYFSTLSYRF